MEPISKVLRRLSSTPTRTGPQQPRPSAAAKCAECDGQGFYRYDVPLGHPYFGRQFPCPACNRAELDYRCGLKEHERTITFEQIITDGRPHIAQALAGAREFTARPRGFFSIHGPNGNGKTMLLMAMVNAIIETGREARYMTGADLLAYLRETFNEETKESDYSRLHQLAAVPVLAIDELDKLRDTPYSREMQQELINLRYRDARTFGTVLAWNGGMDALPWPAVRSRLNEFPVYYNGDKDMRPLLKGN